MVVLGINSFTHDISAAINIDGEIHCAIEEERLSQRKHHPGLETGGDFPRRSVEWVLEYTGISIDEVDFIAHVGTAHHPLLKEDLAVNKYREFAKTLDPNQTKTIFWQHHAAHAASAYYASGFDKALVLTIDGSGDWTSLSISEGAKGSLCQTGGYSNNDSLGFLYEAFTINAGFSPFAEGSLTALSAFGKKSYSGPSLISWKGHRYGSNYRLNKDYQKIIRGLDLEPADLAFTAQDLLEKTVIKLIEQYDYINSNIALAGGVTLNCKLNGKIQELPQVENLFIQPAANDAGTAIGATYLVCKAEGVEPKKMKDMYLGPDLLNIKEYINKNKLKAFYIKDPARLAAKLISEGKIVAWAQGRLEFGPRALGHRSLLGDPRSLIVKDKLNRIKQREEWRPTCPSIIRSDKVYMDYDRVSRFMTKAARVNELGCKEMPAGIHIDNTARAQLVEDKNDPFYKLIKAFEQITTVPAVLNTSLNTRGAPICNSVEDVLRFFYSTETDDLIIGNYHLTK